MERHRLEVNGDPGASRGILPYLDDQSRSSPDVERQDLDDQDHPLLTRGTEREHWIVGDKTNRQMHGHVTRSVKLLAVPLLPAVVDAAFARRAWPVANYGRSRPKILTEQWNDTVEVTFPVHSRSLARVAVADVNRQYT